MSMSTRVLPLVWLTAACGFPRPADVPEPIACTPNEFVDCDGDGARTCNATGDGAVTQDCGVAGCNADAKRCNQCAPSSDSCVAGANALDHCDPNGLPATQDTCSLACTTTPTPHCAYLEPRYLPDVCDVVAPMPAFTVSNVASFDTALDNNCTGGVVDQQGGPQICVVRYRSIDVADTGTLIVSGVRALALVADDAIAIDGVLDVSASGPFNGPGGGATISGDKATSNGGGGAGFATAGAPGGSATMSGAGGAGGGKATDPSIVTVLVGGNHPAAANLNGPGGGGGGGATTLISCRGGVTVKGTIDAGGGGGDGGRFGLSSVNKFGGGGGGSGGNVVLQGLSITVTGQVFANGGGGGAGLFVPAQGAAQAGEAGEDGARSATVAASGGIPPGTAGGGGAGGRQGAAPTFGLPPSDSTTGFPGGGGGSVGFLQSYAPKNVTPTLTPTAASPAFGANKTINTR